MHHLGHSCAERSAFHLQITSSHLKVLHINRLKIAPVQAERNSALSRNAASTMLHCGNDVLHCGHDVFHCGHDGDVLFMSNKSFRTTGSLQLLELVSLSPHTPCHIN